MITWLILFGVLIDLCIGDPVYRFHPVRLIGTLALRLESALRNNLKSKRLAGIVTALTVLFISTFITYLITATLLKLYPPLGFIAGVFFVYSSIACKDMIKHSKEIYLLLKEDNIILARAKTGMIVGRDTRDMSPGEIIRATVESIAENSVDGTLAPLFYAFIGSCLYGVTGAACFAILYRAVNTLDSSFGYKNEKYRSFGMFSARIDDVFNFLPARLSLILIAFAALFTGLDWKKSICTGLRDHSNHASPNSGYSEAAFAGALSLRFGGETRYDNKIILRPYLGDKIKDFDSEDIKLASRLLFNTTLLTTLVMTVILFFISY